MKSWKRGLLIENTKWDYIIPIGLSAISIIILTQGLLFAVSMTCETGDCDLRLDVLTQMMVLSMGIMLIFTIFTDLRIRIIVFPVIFFLGILVLNRGKTERVGYLISVISFYGSGYTIGNISLWLKRRVTS